MKVSFSELLKWFAVVFFCNDGRGPTRSYALGYQSCLSSNALSSGFRNVNSMQYPISTQQRKDKTDGHVLRMSMDSEEDPTEGIASQESRRTQSSASPITPVTNMERETFLDYPELEIIEFEGILNFRSALPGSGLPLYRCAALDNATASDTERLLNPETLNPKINLDSANSRITASAMGGLNICTILDLRNTDEVIAAYKYRTYNGAIFLYSFFRIVLDTATSLTMKANTNSFYARSFDSVVRDLHYSPTKSTATFFTNSLYQSRPLSSPSTSSSSSSLDSQAIQRSGRIGGVSRKAVFPPRNIFELPLFGESEEFWKELKEITVKAGMSSLMADFRWLFDPKALNTQLSGNLAAGGLPLLYEVLLEVSSRRIASALFVCLVVCEDHVSYLEKKLEKITVEMEESRKNRENGTNVDDERDGEKGGDGGSGVIVGPLAPQTYSSGLLFHCAQGKDRTGILSMLLTFSLYGDSPETEERAVKDYAVSEELLQIGRERGGEKSREEYESGSGNSNGMSGLLEGGNNGQNSVTSSSVYSKTIDDTQNSTKKKGDNTNLGEIQSLKGSPPQALRDTLQRVRIRYGSVMGYLDGIGFTKEYRKRFQIAAERTKYLTRKISYVLNESVEPPIS